MKIYFDLHPLEPDAGPGKGLFQCPYAIVGIAPSPNRQLSRYNEPFGTSSINLLKRARLPINDGLYWTNLIKTPMEAGKKIRKADLRTYYPRLIRELELIQPGKILAMGTGPAQVLCPGFDSLREDHGTLFWNPVLNCLVVPTWPAFSIGHDPSKWPFFERDIERFMTLSVPPKPPVLLLKSAKDLPGFIFGDKVYVDLETTGLDKETETVISCSIKASSRSIAYVALHPDRLFFDQLFKDLKESGCVLVCHNLQFDLDWMQYITGYEWTELTKEDTMLEAHVLGEEVLSLKHLTTFYTDRPGSRAFGGPEDLAYNAEDAYSTEEIDKLFQEQEISKNFSAQLLNRLVPHIIRMKNEGVRVDYELLKELHPKYQKEVKAQEDKLNKLAGQELNWNSTAQVVDFLLDQGVELTEKTEAGKFTVKESVLLALQDQYPIVKDLLSLREKKKELEFFDSYSEMLIPESPFLHPRLKLTGTRTGRLSCENPNVQQVKRTGPIKLLYISKWPGGYIGLIDLSQAELRVLCLLSEDREFMEALKSEDVHREMASIAFQLPKAEISSAQRKKSKGITFGLAYGGSPAGLSSRTGIPEEQINQILDRLFKAYPKLMAYIEGTKELGVRQGYIETPLGRIRDLKGLIALKGERDAKRKAINTPIQGTASDIALMIMLYSAEQMFSRKMNSRVIFGVHDSVLLDIHPAEVQQVARIVQDAFINIENSPLSQLALWTELPIVGELIMGKTWAHVESTNENYDKDHNLTFVCTSLPEGRVGGIISERDQEDEVEDEEEVEVEEV